VSELAFPDPLLRARDILLRPWSAADVPAIVAACQDPTIPAYMAHIPSPYSDVDAISWLNSQEPNWIAGTRLELAVADPADERLLGAIGASDVDMTQLTASVGYWLALDARGHGHATSALRLFARWLFDELGLARLELTTDPQNIASRRVAERCGFRQEGYLRSYLRFIYTTGERRDSLIWGLLCPANLSDRVAMLSGPLLVRTRQVLDRYGLARSCGQQSSPKLRLFLCATRRTRWRTLEWWFGSRVSLTNAGSAFRGRCIAASCASCRRDARSATAMVTET
jgi:RimJ/RimL family protein N-acetyltransferase